MWIVTKGMRERMDGQGVGLCPLVVLDGRKGRAAIESQNNGRRD